MMKPIFLYVGIVLALLLLAWVGLRIKPAPFSSFGGPSDATEKANIANTIPLPKGLPAPVEEFYRQTYGENVPVITSVVISGRGTMAPFGVALPMRYRFIYDMGAQKLDYHAIIEASIFRLPVMKVNETYIDGRAVGRMPYGTDEGKWFDDAMNVRVWSEIMSWFPAALLTDSRVRWDPVDETTALLVVPFGKQQQRIVVRFDPETGGIQYFEAMKYRDANHKILWINGIWADQGKAWFLMYPEETVYNVDVSAAIQEENQ